MSKQCIIFFFSKGKVPDKVSLSKMLPNGTVSRRLLSRGWRFPFLPLVSSLE